MKFSTAHKIGVITSDDPPRGGLGRALREIVSVLQEAFTVAAIQKSRCSSWFVFPLQQWIDQNYIETLLLPIGPGGLFLFRKPKRCRTIVICYHTYWQQCRMVPGEWWKIFFVPLERRTLRMADSVFCYCEDTQKVVREKYGIRNAQLMPQILDLEQWVKHPSPPWDRNVPVPRGEGLCLFIGRPERRKGIHVLQKAWKNVSKRLPSATLKTIDRGDLPQAELIALVQSADLVVCPSYLEGFSLVVAQAMAAGTPVIACDSDGIRCLIRHDETGWLVPRGDADALAAGIVHLLCDYSLRVRFAASAQDDILMRFKREQSASALLQELRKI